MTELSQWFLNQIFRYWAALICSLRELTCAAEDIGQPLAVQRPARSVAERHG